MACVPRPTLRCLDDLDDGWDTAQHQRAVNAGMQGPPALSALEHPFIQYVVGRFAELSEDIRRETISGLSDPKFYKAKSGRWRGAVYFDSDGQAWLVAAGMRRAGDRSDFYRAFCASVDADGPGRYLPAPPDLHRLRREVNETKLRGWETAVHNASLDALSRAVDIRTASWTLKAMDSGADIATFTIHYEILDPDGDEPEGYGEVTVEVEIHSWEHNALIEHAEIIALCAIQPRAARWIPAHLTNRMFSIGSTAEQLRAMTTDALQSDRSRPRDVVVNEHAHWTHEQRLTENYVEGRPVRALCGIVFVPTRLADDLQRCPRCEVIYQALSPSES